MLIEGEASAMSDVFPPDNRVCGYVRDSGGRDQNTSANR